MLGKTNVKIKPNKRVQYVEYIESTGTQWIDTGFKPKYNTRMILEVSDVDDSSTVALFGCRNQELNTASEQYGVLILSTTSQLRSDYFGTNTVMTVLDKTIKTIFDKDKNVFSAYGKTINNDEKTIGESTYNAYLFCYNNIGTASYFSKYKLYGCKIYDDGILVRDFKPVKDGAGVYCLYDEVEKRYYYNQGTGEFLGGVAV